MAEEKVFSATNPLRYEDFAPTKEEWEAVTKEEDASEVEESVDDILFPEGKVKEDAPEPEDSTTSDDEPKPEDATVSDEEVYVLDIGDFEGKTYRVVLPNGNILEIPEGSQIYNKVDGEVKPLPLKEQMSVASGSVAISKRLSEIEYTRREIEEQKQSVLQRDKQISDSLETFRGAVYSGEVDPEVAIEALSDAFGVEPGTLLDSIIAMGQKVGARIFQNEIAPKMRAMGLDIQRAMTTTDPAEITYRDNLIRSLSKEAFEARNAKYRGQRAEVYQRTQDQKAGAVEAVKTFVQSQYDTFGINDDDVKFTMDLIGPDEVRKSKAKGLKEHAKEMIELAVHHKKILNFNTALEEMKVNLKDDEKVALFQKVSKIYVPGRHGKDALLDIITGSLNGIPRKKVVPTKKEVASKLKSAHTATSVNINGSFKKVDDFKKLIPK